MESRKEKNERQLLVNIAKRTGTEAHGWSLYADGTAITVLPTQKGDHSCSRSLAGPTNVCKPEVAPASVCSSYFKRKLSQGNGDCGCQVVPSKATSGHASNTRTYVIRCLCSKAEIKVSRTQKRLKKWVDCCPHCSRACLVRNHLPPCRIPGSLEWMAFEECRVWALAEFPSGLLGWLALCPGDRHRGSLPQCSTSTIRESKKALLSWLLLSSLSLASKGKGGRPTEQGKSQKGMNFN